MKELKITDDKVREAAKTCSTAREVLGKLFPEVFEEENYFDLSKLKLRDEIGDGGEIFIFSSSREAGFSNSAFLRIRKGGEFGHKAFMLDDNYYWDFKKDNAGYLLLLPTKRQT